MGCTPDSIFTRLLVMFINGDIFFWMTGNTGEGRNGNAGEDINFVQDSTRNMFTVTVDIFFVEEIFFLCVVYCMCTDVSTSMQSNCSRHWNFTSHSREAHRRQTSRLERQSSNQSSHSRRYQSKNIDG